MYLRCPESGKYHAVKVADSLISRVKSRGLEFVKCFHGVPRDSVGSYLEAVYSGVSRRGNGAPDISRRRRDVLRNRLRNDNRCRLRDRLGRDWLRSHRLRYGLRDGCRRGRNGLGRRNGHLGLRINRRGRDGYRCGRNRLRRGWNRLRRRNCRRGGSGLRGLGRGRGRLGNSDRRCWRLDYLYRSRNGRRRGLNRFSSRAQSGIGRPFNDYRSCSGGKHVQNLGGGFGKIDNPCRHKGPPVIYPDGDLAVILFIGNYENGTEWQGWVGCRKKAGIKDFPRRCGFSVKFNAVPGSDSFLPEEIPSVGLCDRDRRNS